MSTPSYNGSESRQQRRTPMQITTQHGQHLRACEGPWHDVFQHSQPGNEWQRLPDLTHLKILQINHDNRISLPSVNRFANALTAYQKRSEQNGSHPKPGWPRLAICKVIHVARPSACNGSAFLVPVGRVDCDQNPCTYFQSLVKLPVLRC